uniref:Uncharacterized protein n=1 Tax=Anguilla anguilla TaxID=7936 RepID=A0A0E9TUF2_ANGAN
MRRHSILWGHHARNIKHEHVLRYSCHGFYTLLHLRFPFSYLPDSYRTTRKSGEAKGRDHGKLSTLYRPET